MKAIDFPPPQPPSPPPTPPGPEESGDDQETRTGSPTASSQAAPSPVASNFFITRCAWCRHGLINGTWWPVKNWHTFYNFKITDSICPTCKEHVFDEEEEAPVHPGPATAKLLISELANIRCRIEVCEGVTWSRSGPDAADALPVLGFDAYRALQAELEKLSTHIMRQLLRGSAARAMAEGGQ